MIISVAERGSSDLLDDNVYLISVFHIEVFRGLVLVQSFAVKEESHIAGLELSYFTITDCRWQYASISFLSWVVFFILKKTYSPSWVMR
jgi:hypothetical protein